MGEAIEKLLALSGVALSGVACADPSHAMPDGSHHIDNSSDLKDSLAKPSAKDPKVKAHLKKRAKALGLHHLLPKGMKGDGDAEDKADGGSDEATEDKYGKKK